MTVADQTIVKDYRNGLTKTQVLEKHGITTHRLYKTLKLHQIPLQNPRGRKVEAFCDVCGIPLVPAQESSRGAWRYVYTCGSWQCLNILSLRPELRDERKRKHQSKPKIRDKRSSAFFPKRVSREQNKNVVIANWQNCEIDSELMLQIHKHTPTNERWWSAGDKDERGTEANQIAQDSLWGALSRQHVAIRLIDRYGSEVSMSIKRKRDETTAQAFVRVFFGGDTEAAKEFDALLAWRCSCQLKTQMVYKQLGHFPETKGYHAACPCCGAVCLEIL